MFNIHVQPKQSDVSHNTHIEEICRCYTCSYMGCDKDIYIHG